MFKKQVANCEHNVIKKVRFGLYSEQDILKQSVAEVNSLLIYNKETSLPAENGLNDPRMGVTMRGLACQTCFGDLKQCPGHFGHINLAEIVYHPELLETVYKILKSICFNCSKLLIGPEKLPYILQIKNKQKRLNEISKISSNKCGFDDDPGCDKKQPRYRMRKMDILVRRVDEKFDTYEEDSKRVFRASEVYDIFKEISNETIEILGLDPKFSRPEFLLIKLLLVVPPTVRPSIELSSSARSEDDLSHLYQSILSTNLELKKSKEAGLPRTRIDELVFRLQSYVSYLMNNNEGKAKQKGGRPIKAISQRLKGKEGRLRGNLMGKRVDFSSRTVVSPDPSLELDQLGVPVEIATELTIPERVTQLNIEFLKKLVERGDEWPGARYHFSKAHNMEVSDLNFMKSKPNLQNGDIVERHLMDEDYVVFNRQPSLHKMSIMGHRVKVLQGSTFRLNLAVTTPYNADFDGDEMNMHVPQNIEATSEVKHLMSVPKQVITPQSNRAVMGLNQDSLLGIMLFSRKDTFLDKACLFDLLMHLEDWNGELPQPAIVCPVPLWSGKQVLSLIIPKINYIRMNERELGDFYFDDQSIVIKKGQLLVGTLDKSVVGPKKGSLIGCIWIDYGPDKIKDFLSFSQKLIIQWMLSFGWTVGIADTIAPVALLKVIERKRVESKLEFHAVLRDTQQEKKKLIVHQPGKTIIESFEHKVNTLLNDCRAEIGKLLNENIGRENHIKNMIISGSKGNNINISQISGLVGQQNVEGRRIPFGFLNRTLPHFLQNDFGPESRGFVANSYYKGLTPEEFFFHTMGGREGLIDTAVKTSQTGYIQRRLVKALEDVMVQYDGSVRDSMGNIIQYLYGEDGISGEFIEEQRYDLLRQSDANLKSKCLFWDYDETLEDLGFEDSVQRFHEEGRISFEVKDSLLSDKKAHQILEEEYEAIVESREKLRKKFPPGSKIGILPVNLDRLITQSQFQNEAKKGSDLNPLYVIDRLKAHLEKLRVIYLEQNGNDLLNFSTEANNRALFLFRSFVQYKLCSRRVILEYKLRKKSFDFLLKEIELSFRKARVNPGEMCGSIAAQSLGETLTQMTLNTFHFAGVSSQNITLGVPRIQEIINCSRNIKGASMMIYLEEPYRFSAEEVHKLISTLEFTTVGQLTTRSEVYYEPKLSETCIPEDEDLLFLEEEHEVFSPWVLRVCIDPVLLGRKGISLDEILAKIKQYSPRSLQLISSLETADPIVIRIRLLQHSAYAFNDIKKIEQYLLNDMSIKGFCKKVSYRRQEKKRYSDKGVEIEGDGLGEFILETSGTDIKRVLRLDKVDKSRTSTNDIWDIYTNFGVEAARTSIIREIKVVFIYFNIYVNERHISLLAEAITAQGGLMSISRNGINRIYTSPFRKSSFEETVDILIKASIYSTEEFLKGVTENVMVGQLCRMGTGAFSVLMDTDYLLPTEENKEKVAAMYSYFPDLNPALEVEVGIDDDLISRHMQTPVPQMNTPAPGNKDLLDNRTPLYQNLGVQSPMIYKTPVMSPGRTPLIFPGQPNPRMLSPHQNNVIYSPFIKRQYEEGTPNYRGIKSPFLNPALPQHSPHHMGYLQGQGFIEHPPSELKYSPITPAYNASPNRLQSPNNIQRLQSPNSSRHLSNMSPSYSYSNSSPSYSPNSNNSPNLSNPSSSRIKNSPYDADSEKLVRHVYNPESPSYQKHLHLVEKEEKYSDEEDEEPEIKKEN